ncbi:dihydrodipicolinate reductase [Litorivivens sp.]|uniref:NAD(P)H-dependent amine dehydrogenase family protein n=1 Tax=Litorivivens sp. TaxID=2020868 RepID=UPI00356646C7
MKVAVWGTGNVGRPAIRAVLNHAQLELVGVIVSSEAKVGRDAGELAGVAPVGLKATLDYDAVLAQGLDAMIYTASADIRPDEALADLLTCLRAGCNVVSTSFYDFLHPALAPRESMDKVEAACHEGKASLFVSGIDPGWAMDIMPVFGSGMVSGITQIRCQEIFNYALYDAPDIVRYVIGFGQPMEELPLMLHSEVLLKIWEPMVRLVAQGVNVELDEVTTQVERRPLEKSVDVKGMGTFEKGGQGAFRFEVMGMKNGKPLIVAEHITRIDASCAPDWPYPPNEGGCHRVLISGDPDLEITVHGHDHHDSGAAAGGNATAANRVVNAIPAVCGAAPGVVSPWDLPAITGAAQIKC